MRTSYVKSSAEQWHLIDADGKTLGKVVSKVSMILQGKTKPQYAPHVLCGDHVIIVNVSGLKFIPAKLHRKTYVKYSGYPGHLRTESLGSLFKRKPEEVIMNAIKGMLPNNRLKKGMLKHLHVYAGSEHRHEAQKPVKLDI